MTMFRLWLTLFFSTNLLIISGLPTAAIAALPEGLTQDFAPLDGYVIMPVNDEYLVDLDAAKGAGVGDLLSVSQAGEAIVHPISGEIIGTLNQKLAVLSITRIKSGYSYAQVVSGDKSLSKGTPVKRFAGLSARFNGHGVVAADTYLELAAALPDLDWQGHSTAALASEVTATDLLFTLTATTLEVYNAAGQRLRSYPLSTPAASEVLANPTPASAPPITLGTAETAVTWQAQPQKAVPGLVSYESGNSGERLIGSFQAATLMADFVATTDGLLLAATDGSMIRVFRVTDQLHSLTEYKLPPQATHGLSWWQPTPETLYLTVSGSSEGPPSASTSTETTPNSSVLAFTDGTLVPVVDNLRYFLGTLDRDGDERDETLLGQGLDLDRFYGQVMQLQLKGDKIGTSSPDFKTPHPFPVQSSLSSNLSGDDAPETVTLANGLLTIYQGTKRIYQSKKELGGSISQLTYDTNPGQMDALFTSATFEVAPVAADIDGDGQRELLAVSSDHPTFVSPAGGSNISETWLSVFKFKDGRFIKGRIGSTFDRPIQGLHASNERIFLVTSGPTSDEDPRGSSRLLAIPLQKGN